MTPTIAHRQEAVDDQAMIQSTIKSATTGLDVIPHVFNSDEDAILQVHFLSQASGTCCRCAHRLLHSL